MADLQKDEKRALQALIALQLYGQSAPLGPLWPRALNPEETVASERKYAVDQFSEFAGMTPEAGAKALGGLRDRGLVVFGEAGLGLTPGAILVGLSS